MAYTLTVERGSFASHALVHWMLSRLRRGRMQRIRPVP